MNFNAPYANTTYTNMPMESIRNELSSRFRPSSISKNGLGKISLIAMLSMKVTSESTVFIIFPKTIGHIIMTTARKPKTDDTKYRDLPPPFKRK